MQIITGKVKSAQKFVVYGPEGVGKSTFASKFPSPIFIDTEGSTKKLNVSRFERPTSWEMLLEQINYVSKNYKSLGIKTLVIDTADWAEKLCIEQICSKAKKTGIEDFGYGKGYVYLAEDFGRLLNRCEDLVDIGINVVITAHAQMRKFEQPDEMGSYDRWELKLEKKTAPLLKEWADTLLFANYQTNVIKVNDNKYKAQGSKRVMYTTHNACYDAKNRDGLPDVLPFEYEAISHIADNSETIQQENVKTFDFSGESPQQQEITKQEVLNELDKMVDTAKKEKETSAESKNEELPDYIPKKLADLMRANNVTEADIQRAVASRGYYPIDTSIKNYDSGFIEGCLIGAWEKVYQIIIKNNDLPF